MSELYNVWLMKLEDYLRKIAKVIRYTCKRIRAAEEHTRREEIIASSNVDDILKLSKTANRDNLTLGRQPQRGRDRS